MTPEEAQHILAHIDRLDLPDFQEPETRKALETIAGMRTEYAVQVRRSGGWEYSREEDDFRWQPLTVQLVRADRDHPHEETRIVCRYVTEPEQA